jgi:hypothetical protein
VSSQEQSPHHHCQDTQSSKSHPHSVESLPLIVSSSSQQQQPPSLSSSPYSQGPFLLPRWYIYSTAAPIILVVDNYINSLPLDEIVLLVESLLFIPVLGDESAPQYLHLLLLLLRPSCLFWHRGSLRLTRSRTLTAHYNTLTVRGQHTTAETVQGTTGEYSFAVLSRIGHFSSFVNIFRVLVHVSFPSFYPSK